MIPFEEEKDRGKKEGDMKRSLAEGVPFISLETVTCAPTVV